jgi:hypothetical protein
MHKSNDNENITAAIKACCIKKRCAMDRVFTREDIELLDQLKNRIRQQQDFVVEQLVEESIEDCPA